MHLELGGKAPVVVFDDADVDLLVSTMADMSYYNSGQDCTAPCRIIAGPEGVRRRGRRTDRRGWCPAVGDPFDPGTNVGPIVSGDHQHRVAD